MQMKKKEGKRVTKRLSSGLRKEKGKKGGGGEKGKTVPISLPLFYPTGKGKKKRNATVKGGAIREEEEGGEKKGREKQMRGREGQSSSI